MKLNSLHINAEKATPEGWVASISRDGQLLRSGIFLKDPLSPEEGELCRWYLEDFIQKSPFVTDRALTAEDLLLDYPHTLVKTLGLDNLIFSLFGWGSDEAEDDRCGVVWHIVISQSFESSDGDSIHRLLWETIEWPELWNSNVQVIVQRSFWDETGNSPSHEAPFLGLREYTAVPTVNVLVVVARDLRRNPSAQYQDVSPGLATDILLKVKEILEQKDSSINLNIEIVRPGTFSALKSHLKHREEHNGPGYFQAVHFDLHGKIGDRAGSGEKTGILYFSRPWDAYESNTTEKDTMAVAAVSVCRLVAKHKIPLVLLNACESASSGSGSEANIAQQFLKRGAQNVIGMSFKVSDRAAAIFLEHFYRALFIGGFSVSMSAGLGRMALRAQINRPAKYGLQRKLRDGFVPISYGDCGRLLFQNASTVPRETPVERYFSALKALATEEDLMVKSIDCFAREFDLLRLERLITERGVTYLRGVAGVGKSTFLRLAVSRWKKTHLSDVHIVMDFTRNQKVCRRDVIIEITQQLKSELSQVDQLALMALDAIDLSQGQRSDDHKAATIILNVLKTIRSTVVVEGLDLVSSPPLSSDALPLIHEFIRIATDPTFLSTCHVILAQRSDNTYIIESMVDFKFKSCTYELLPFDLPEAIQFSSQIAEASGEDVSTWKYSDFDWLESTIELLQRIPGTLVTILPLRRQIETWEVFYMRLQAGLFASIDEVKAALPNSCTAVKDIQALLAVPPFAFVLSSIISLYWRVSPSRKELFPIFCTIVQEQITVSPSTLKLTFDLFFARISDHGYISSDNDVEYIHPMVTIISGPMVKKHLTLANRAMLARALARSLEDINYHPAMRFDDSWGPNYHTIMKSCGEQLPIEHWPLSFMALCCRSVPECIPVGLRAVLDATHCKLLAVLGYQLNLLDGQARHLIFYSFTLLTIALRYAGLENAKHEEILALAERGYKSISWLPFKRHTTQIKVCKALLLTTVSLMLRSLERVDSFKQKMEDLLRLLGSLDVAKPPSTSELTGVENAVNASGTEHHTSESNALFIDFLVSLVRNTVKTLNKRNTALEPERTAKVLQLQNLLEEILPEQKQYMEISDNVLWQLYMSQMSLLLEPSQHVQVEPLEGHEQTELLGRIADVQNVEDWFEACSAHTLMARDAASLHQFQGAIAHLQSVDAVLKKVDVPEQLIGAVQSCHDRIMNAWQNFKFSRALITRTFFDVVREPANVFSLTQCSCSCSVELARLTSSYGMAGEASKKPQVFEVNHPRTSTEPVVLCLEYLHKYDMEATVSLIKVMAALGERDFDEASEHFKKLKENIELLFANMPPKAQLFVLQIQHFLGEMSEYKELLVQVNRLALMDISSARSFICDAVSRLKHFTDSQASMIMKELSLLVTKQEFVMLRIAVLSALRREDTVPKQGIRPIFVHALQKFRDGCFVELGNKINVVDTCIQAADWLISDAAKSQQWQKVLEYCEQYEAYAPVSHREDPSVKVVIFHHRERAEFALAAASLNEAEATLDFARCLVITDHLRSLAGFFRSSPFISIVATYSYSDKTLEGLTEAYEKRCLACARWIRQRAGIHLLPKDGRLLRVYGRVIWLLQACARRRCHPSVCSRRLMGEARRRQGKSRFRRAAILRKRSRKRQSLRRRRCCCCDGWHDIQKNGHQCQRMKEKMFKMPPFGCEHRCEGEFCFS